MTQAVALRDTLPVEISGERSIEEVVAQSQKIHGLMRTVMKSGEHYGTIPGTDKPTLLKPGAEILLFTFRLDPQYDATERYDGSHLTVVSRCTIYHITTGLRLGSGMGSCSTKETKYAYRMAARTCPKCQKAAIIKGKAEYGGGWVCFKKKDGCGAKFPDTDALIVNQPHGRVPNEDVADVYNTVLKMANKRALVAAVLNVTAASETFTQDLEDITPEAAPPAEESAPRPVRSVPSQPAEVDERDGDTPDPIEADVVAIIAAFDAETDAKKGAALFHTTTKSDFWGQLTTSQQQRIIDAKNRMKTRLGVAA